MRNYVLSYESEPRQMSDPDSEKRRKRKLDTSYRERALASAEEKRARKLARQLRERA